MMKEISSAYSGSVRKIKMVCAGKMTGKITTTLFLLRQIQRIRLKVVIVIVVDGFQKKVKNPLDGMMQVNGIQIIKNINDVNNNNNNSSVRLKIE
jgi:hypothetical protein